MQCAVPLQAIVSSAIWAAAIGAVGGGRIADRIGRRTSLALADMLFIAGSLTMAAAPSIPVLILGRVLVGLGIGVASVTVPMFIAEVSAAHVRARAVTANVLAITGTLDAHALLTIPLTPLATMTSLASRRAASSCEGYATPLGSQPDLSTFLSA